MFLILKLKESNESNDKKRREVSRLENEMAGLEGETSDKQTELAKLKRESSGKQKKIDELERKVSMEQSLRSLTDRCSSYIIYLYMLSVLVIFNKSS